jgi:transcriptional regulator with XRE-family HTH domain
MKKPRYTMARFPRLRVLRESLGWEAKDLAAKLADGKPSISSIYRLEQGGSIRAPMARRVFDLVNDALGRTLDPTKELKS